MLWTPKGVTIDPRWIGDLEPLRVLIEYEGPRTFIARDPKGDMLFAHQCGESQDLWRYAVVLFSEKLLSQLESGRIDLWNSLDREPLWLVGIDVEGKVIECTRTLLEDIPASHLPLPDVTLSPEVASLLSLRLKGRDIELGTAASSVLSHAVESGRTALRKLTDYSMGRSSQRGRQEAEITRLYDLPATILAGSVQVLFHRPNGDLTDQQQDTLNEVRELLAYGLNSAAVLLQESAEGDDEVEADHEDESAAPANIVPRRLPIDIQNQAPDLLDESARRFALEAVSILAPSPDGKVESVEVRGVLSSEAGSSSLLTQETRPVVNKEIRHIDDDGEQECSGTIIRINFEQKTLVLYDGSSRRTCRYKDEHEFTVRVAVREKSEVKIVGRRNPSNRVIVASTIEAVS